MRSKEAFKEAKLRNRQDMIQRRELQTIEVHVVAIPSCSSWQQSAGNNGAKVRSQAELSPKARSGLAVISRPTQPDAGASATGQGSENLDRRRGRRFGCILGDLTRMVHRRAG